MKVYLVCFSCSIQSAIISYPAAFSDVSSLCPALDDIPAILPFLSERAQDRREAFGAASCIPSPPPGGTCFPADDTSCKFALGYRTARVCIAQSSRWIRVRAVPGRTGGRLRPREGESRPNGESNARKALFS